MTLCVCRAELATVRAAKGSLEEQLQVCYSRLHAAPIFGPDSACIHKFQIEFCRFFLQSVEGELMRERLRADMAERELGEERTHASAAVSKVDSERRLRRQAEEDGAGLRRTVESVKSGSMVAASSGAVEQQQQLGFVPVQTVQLMTAAISANAAAMDSLVASMARCPQPSKQQP